jgi:CRP-like cAMP-binding protein
MRDSIKRLLTLRQFPGMANLELAELAVIAENVTEVDYPEGAVVAPAGRTPALHLIVEGRIDVGAKSYGPRQVFGGLFVIAGRQLATTAIAAVATRVLQLSAIDFAEILEDNFGLLTNVRRGLARQLLAGPRAYVRPRLPYTVRPESLGLVDRLILLRHQITFATGRIGALASLAQATREVRFNPGDLLTRAGELATSSIVVIDGRVRTRETDPRVLGPNDALGVVESLAETAYTMSAEAVTPVRALECPSIALFDVIEDHTDLALALIARLASEILDADPVETPLAKAN